jgi:hypothetical protein
MSMGDHFGGFRGVVIEGKGKHQKEIITPNGQKSFITVFDEITDVRENIIPIGGYQYVFDKLFNIPIDQNSTLRVGNLNDEAPQMKIGVSRQNYASSYYNFEVVGSKSTDRFSIQNQVGNIQTPPNSGINISAMNYIFGFMVGDGGAKSDNKTPIAPNYKDRGLFRAVPFRMTTDGTIIPEDTYFGKSSVQNGNETITSYYVKKFDNPAPHIVHCWASDNPKELQIVDDTVFSSTSSTAIESFVEINISITDEDCRGYFTTTDTTGCINEIALVSGWYNMIENDYEQLMIFSHFTRPSIPLTEGDAIEAVYRIYAR